MQAADASGCTWSEIGGQCIVSYVTRPASRRLMQLPAAA
jgi:hypothetical protein